MRDNTLLKTTAAALFADYKGILAADESTNTIEKRFAAAKIENTEENRRAYREMLFTTPAIGEYISGVILFDETIRQKASDGRTLAQVLQAANVIPGIKVDQGTAPMSAGGKLEYVTKGIDGLPARLNEYAALGARFAKWRAVITIGEGTPTDDNIRQNAADLSKYATLCQEAGLVPIVEPEVLMDGAHDMAKCREASEKTLLALFDELHKAQVLIEGTILKTGMVLPGNKSQEKKTPQEIAEATVDLFKKTLPEGLPGVVFLSGGQSELEATQNLEAIAEIVPEQWKISFSYGRALQDSAIQTWAGNIANVGKAQEAFYHRAQMNSMAVQGIYTADIETTGPEAVA